MSSGAHPKPRTSTGAVLGLVVFGATAGVLLGLAALWWTDQLPWRGHEASNGLVPSLLAQWRADPTYFVRRGERFESQHPFMPAQSFGVTKGDRELRVFVLGSSQAMGDPYVHARTETEGLDLEVLHIANSGGIATWLAEYLRLLYPKREIDVVNAAIGSQDLTTAAEVMHEVAAKGQPDLVVVLDGNNESFNRTHTDLAAFEATLNQLTPRYAVALQAIRDTAETHAIPTYVLTVPTNLRDWLPSTAGQTMAKVDLDRILASQQWAAGLAQLQQLGGSDHALAFFLQGRALEASGEQEAAYAQYLRAKDLDFNLLRAHSRWNDAVRQLAGKFVHVLDLEAELQHWSPSGLPGFDLFHDHCHFRLDTNVRVARFIAAFHQDQAGLQPQELPIIDARARMQANLQALYAIKERKWRRLQESPDFDHLGDENARNVESQFRNEMDAIERMIRVRAADLQ